MYSYILAPRISNPCKLANFHIFSCMCKWTSSIEASYRSIWLSASPCRTKFISMQGQLLCTVLPRFCIYRESICMHTYSYIVIQHISQLKKITWPAVRVNIRRKGVDRRMNNIKEAHACFSVVLFLPLSSAITHLPYISLSLSSLFIEGIACLCMLMGEGGSNQIRLRGPVPVFSF